MDQKIIDNFFTKLSLKIKDETKIILLERTEVPFVEKYYLKDVS